MGDFLKFSINITPVEEVTEYYGITGEDVDIDGHDSAQTRTKKIIASEVKKSLGSNGKIDLDYVNVANGQTNGFSGGVPHYLNVSNGTTWSSSSFPSVTNPVFLYLKHTGYRGSAGGNFAVDANDNPIKNEDDYLGLAQGNGNVIIALLKAGESVFLPLRMGNASLDSSFRVKSTNPMGQSNGDYNIAAEFFCIAGTGGGGGGGS